MYHHTIHNMESGIVWASNIFNGKIWLGAGRDAQNLKKLVECEITHIVNCADDVPNFHQSMEKFTYLNLFVADFGCDVGIARVFAQAFNFVKNAMDSCSDNRILIHCANGSNRSATVAVAVLMKLNGNIIMYLISFNMQNSAIMQTGS
jgi:hypothetical protein